MGSGPPRIDACTYLGHWPFRRLPQEGIDALRDLSKRTRADHALVGSFNAAFYLDPIDANEEAWEAIDGDPFFTYVPVVNPLLPWWKKDIDWAKERGCPAVWLFPNWWGLKLSDPPGERLLETLREAGLGLVVSARLNDERLLPPEFYRPSVPAAELAWVVRQWPDIPVMLVSTTWQEVEAIGFGAIRDSSAVVEISFMKQPTHLVEYLVQAIGAEHVAFGSGIPIHYAEAATYRLEMAEISDDERAAVLGGTIASTFNLNPDGSPK